jgi:hypothetical protein
MCPECHCGIIELSEKVALKINKSQTKVLKYLLRWTSHTVFLAFY